MMEHRCRLLQRGITASAFRPDYCPAPYPVSSIPLIKPNDITVAQPFPMEVILAEVFLFILVVLALIIAWVILARKKGLLLQQQYALLQEKAD